MVLTPKQIYDLRVRSGMDAFRPMKEHWQAKDDVAAYRFARAIEAEVRKQDDALILQLVEALENSHATLWEEEDDPERPAHAAIAAGPARLAA